jgi:hypothetical protein
VIDTAWAAVLPNKSTIVPTNPAKRIDIIKRKGCTLVGPYFFFFFAVFFFAVFFAFFAFIAVSFHL